MPASSSAVSPFAAMADSANAICASLASGSRRACKNSAASVSVRSSLRSKRDVASPNAPLPMICSQYICLNSSAGQSQRLHHRARFVDRFLVFPVRVGIRHNSSASLKISFAIFQHHRSQSDAEIDVAIKYEIPDSAAVTAASGPLQLADDVH